MDNFLFTVARKRLEKKFKEELPEITAYGTVVSKAVPWGTVITEAEELIPVFLHPEVQATLSKYPHSVHLIHFTDQSSSTANHKKMLRFVFQLSNDPTEITTLLRMALHFIDLIADTPLSKAAKEKTALNRKRIAEAQLKQTHAERQELAQKRKYEKKLKELEQLENLSPEAQQKKEEKEQKRVMKKRGPKFKVHYG